MLLNSSNCLKLREPVVHRCSGDSLTVPDGTLTIREMMDRFAKGIPVSGYHSVYYDGINDFDGYDPTLAGDFDFAEAKTLHDKLSENRAKQRQEQAVKLAKETSEKAKAQKEEAERSGADDSGAEPSNDGSGRSPKQGVTK